MFGSLEREGRCGSLPSVYILSLHFLFIVSRHSGPSALLGSWVESLWFSSSGGWTCEFCQIGNGLAVWWLACSSPVFTALSHLCLLWYLASSFGVFLVSGMQMYCFSLSFLCPAKSALCLTKMGWHLWSALVSSSILCVFLSLCAFCFFTVISLDFFERLKR